MRVAYQKGTESMAFVMNTDLGNVMPTVLRHGGSFLAVSEVAIDPVDDQILLLEVCLMPHPSGGLELAFFMSIRDGITGTEVDRIFDGRRTRHLAPAVIRSKVLETVLASVAALIECAMPQTLFMCATEVVPAKAETKYAMIAQVLERMGYEVKAADSYHGRRAWWAYRLVKP
jgi:hypothetical protein